MNNLDQIIRNSCNRIPPLWTLQNYVAVNPFIGYNDISFINAANLIRATLHSDILMPVEFYIKKIEDGSINEKNISNAIRLSKKLLTKNDADFVSIDDPTELLSKLKSSLPSDQYFKTITDFINLNDSNTWNRIVTDEISKWASAYFDQAQTSWRMPWRNEKFFTAWTKVASIDYNPEIVGIKDFRKLVCNLPEKPLDVISYILNELSIPNNLIEVYLTRLLMSNFGWSSYLQYLNRGFEPANLNDDLVVQVLVIRLVYEYSIYKIQDASVKKIWKDYLINYELADYSIDLNFRYVAHLAFEYTFQASLIQKLTSTDFDKNLSQSKLLQAVFCIDVRSEIFRKALEAQSSHISTIGFAGFFGMPFEYIKFGQNVSSLQCPVLLRPSYKITETNRDKKILSKYLYKNTFKETINYAINSFKSSAISSFSFVETLGIFFGFKLIRNTVRFGYSPSNENGFYPDITYQKTTKGDVLVDEIGLKLDDQVSLAKGALQGMGLVDNFAKYVVICGHASSSENNPYASSLDCGACGGNSGELNAKVAAIVLNNDEVRLKLELDGIKIPKNTIFVAALHNTTTDKVTFYSDFHNQLILDEDYKVILDWFDRASSLARLDRSSRFKIKKISGKNLESDFKKRSQDWSQIRPEWGLANNAAFIAAPRDLTKNLNLEGRIFLHDYEESKDENYKILELIITAPMVVASWINLQYFASTVNNRIFGSGNKVLHNIVGTFGVWEGNGGDLKFGLPFQSLHDGKDWVHEPQRLNVIIAADKNAVRGILSKNPNINNLLQCQWINFYVISTSDKKVYRYINGSFESYN